MIELERPYEYTVIATGKKDGRKVKIVCEDGFFERTGIGPWDDEIMDLKLEDVKMGGTYRLDTLEPLRAQWVIDRFFDEPAKCEWYGVPEPKLENDPGVIY